MGDWKIPDDKATTYILLALGILIGITVCCLLHCVKTMMIGTLKCGIYIAMAVLVFIYFLEFDTFWYYN